VTGADDDLVLELMLLAASRAIDGFCNYPDGFLAQAYETREFASSGARHIWVGDMVEVTSVSLSYDGVNFTELTDTDYRGFTGDPDRPNFNRSPLHGLLLVGSTYSAFPSGLGASWESGMADTTSRAARASVLVSGSWGYAEEVPALVKAATIVQASRWFKRGQSFWSDSSADPTGGQMLWKQALDPDMKMMLQLSRLKRPLYGG
jgi:hypothetical protein